MEISAKFSSSEFPTNCNHDRYGLMKTGSFYLYSGPGRVSIARTAPRRVAAGFRIYRALAPGKWLFDTAYMDYAAYRERYFGEILGPLDAQKVWDDLHALADGHEPVLLCHEHLLKPDDWCHRRMVAEWFEQALGVAVPEMVTVSKEKSSAQLDMLADNLK